jgi:hypothetical protein
MGLNLRIAKSVGFPVAPAIFVAGDFAVPTDVK